MTYYFGDILEYLPVMLRALGLSLLVTGISFPAGSALALFACMGRESKWRTIRIIVSAFVEGIRNTPILVHLYVVYFGLAQLGLHLSPFTAAIIAMSVNNSAYMAEIFRGGLKTIPNGLYEAASALALTRYQAFTSVVLKPLIRAIIPSATNQLIVLFLFSSIASVISLPELTSVLLDVNSITLRTLEVFTYGAVLYYLATVSIAFASRRIEKVLFKW